MADAHIADLDDPALGVCYIVAAVNRDCGCIEMVKIGFSRNLWHRVSTLRGGAVMWRIELLASSPGGRAKEKMLHKQFADHAIGREWFNPHPDILAICGLTTCTIGVSDSNHLAGLPSKNALKRFNDIANDGKRLSTHPGANVGRG